MLYTIYIATMDCTERYGFKLSTFVLYLCTAHIFIEDETKHVLVMVTSVISQL